MREVSGNVGNCRAWAVRVMRCPADLRKFISITLKPLFVLTSLLFLKSEDLIDGWAAIACWRRDMCSCIVQY